MSFYVWASLRSTPYAGTYYRVTVPTTWSEKLGYTHGYIDVGKGGQNDVTAMLTADIDLLYAVGGRETLHQIRVINDMQAKKMSDGTLRYPPTVVWDYDDNPDYVHPYNQSFATWGVRNYPTGEFLEKDDVLTSVDAKGEEHILWTDQETASHGHVFDVERNLAEMKLRHKIIREVAGVTVPSPSLARYISDVVGQKNVYVFPNTVVPSDYEEYPLRRDDDDVRILWQGGQSHFIDWFPLREAIIAVFQKYPKAKLVMWGEKFTWITDIIPADRLEYHSWTDYAAFKLKRGLLQIDINLCPLANNPFNWCKSAIKWYEASIWSNPEATLAANVAPYYEIKDGETGLLYSSPEEFVQKMGLLIENAELRKRLGRNAHDWVLKNRTPEKTIPGLIEFYQDCRARGCQGRIIKPTAEQVRKV